MPRGVILSQADVDLIKAFDRNKDGLLDASEMDLAQAAFKALDRGAAPPPPGPGSTAFKTGVRGGKQ